MNDIDARLLDQYRALGLVTRTGVGQHLPTVCACADRCWSGEPAERMPSVGSPASELSPPHVGRWYGRTRLVIVLENLRNYGGFDLREDARVGMRFLARAAQKGFRDGHKVLFRGGGYAGTRVWHQTMTYASTWLARLGHLAGDLVPTSGAALASTMDLIALVQHVKCSPVGGRSEQSATMWNECGNHVLVRELAVLQPARLLVVGTGDNAHAVRHRVLPEAVSKQASKSVSAGRGVLSVELETRRNPWAPGDIEVLVVPHPARPGAASKALIQAVHDVVAV